MAYVQVESDEVSAHKHMLVNSFSNTYICSNG